MIDEITPWEEARREGDEDTLEEFNRLGQEDNALVDRLAKVVTTVFSLRPVPAPLGTRLLSELVEELRVSHWQHRYRIHRIDEWDLMWLRVPVPQGAR